MKKIFILLLTLSTLLTIKGSMKSIQCYDFTGGECTKPDANMIKTCTDASTCLKTTMKGMC